MLYQDFICIAEIMFNKIVKCLQPCNKKKTMFRRKPLDPGLHVAISLRFLSSGNFYQSLGYPFCMASNANPLVIPETCKAIVAEISPTPKVQLTESIYASGICS